jgi:hypothetical protein
VTERELLRAVQALCLRYDVELHHVANPVGGRRGWPDCAMLGTRGAAFRELKSARGSLTAEQEETGRRMRAAGLDWAVWRPRDYESGRAEAQIAALSGMLPWT